MPRQVGVRTSLSSTETSSVTDAVNHNVIQFEKTASRIMERYKDKFPTETIRQWSERLTELAKDSASIINEISLMNDEIDKDGRRRESEPSGSDDYKTITSDIRNAIEKRKNEYDAENSDIVKKIRKILDDKNDTEEDFRVVEQEDTEITFRCPYSYVIMTNPMKNSKCPHHLDKASLDQLLKKPKSVICPISGCGKMWTKDSASSDKELLFRLNRFQRLKNVTSSANASVETTEIFDD